VVPVEMNVDNVLLDHIPISFYPLLKLINGVVFLDVLNKNVSNTNIARTWFKDEYSEKV